MSATFITPKKQLTWLNTGCSSGFGLSFARIMQAAGHIVIGTSRDASSTLELVADEVDAEGEGPGGGRAPAGRGQPQQCPGYGGP